ncbi:luciferase-like domain-containing protein [Xylariales sp. PMI_506]|nr:luciferase-like domain-containing protein [Xylariales sp. PMI_506]
MAPKKQLHLNFFEMSCTGAHMGIGQFKTLGDNQHTKDTLDYYLWLAKLADRGKISCIFFADVYGAEDTYEGSAKACFETGSGVGWLDPMTIVSGMASVSKNVSFGITGSTSYINPFMLTRTVAGLDHLTKGRFAWNIVTSYSKTAAKAMGKTAATEHDRRYDEAHEYMDLVYSMLEGSHEDGAKVFDRETGEAYDWEKVHKVTFKGKYHNTEAWGPTHPSPQRTPVLFQAGTSKAGSAFAGKHAEAIFCGGNKPSDTAKVVKSIREIAAANGRDPNHVKFFPQMTPIIGRTLEEAQEKYQKALANADYRGGLAKMSNYLGIDFSQYPLDEPFSLEGKETNGIQTMIAVLTRDPSIVWTPRKIGQQMAFCGFGPMPVGTPEMIADVMEQWVNEGDIDGFNIAYVSNPTSYEDLVDLLVPVLQERGLMWKDYAVPGGTFRENLLREPGQKTMPCDHPATQFRYENLKKQPGTLDEKGDIVINRRDPVAARIAETVEAAKNLHVNGPVTVSVEA